jgi:hypothetical protein
LLGRVRGARRARRSAPLPALEGTLTTSTTSRSRGEKDRSRADGKEIRRRKPVASRDLRATSTSARGRTRRPAEVPVSASFLLTQRRGVRGNRDLLGEDGALTDEMQLLRAAGTAFGIGAFANARRVEADKQVREVTPHARPCRVTTARSPDRPQRKISDVNRAMEMHWPAKSQLVGTDFADTSPIRRRASRLPAYLPRGRRTSLNLKHVGVRHGRRVRCDRLSRREGS